MRKYTFTFSEAITYELEINAENEVKAVEMIDKMSDDKLRQNIVGRTDMETTKTVKGDFIKVATDKRKGKDGKKV